MGGNAMLSASRWILVGVLVLASTAPAIAQVAVTILASEPGEARELLQRAIQLQAATKRHLAEGTSPDILRPRVMERARELRSVARRILDDSKQKGNMGTFEEEQMKSDLSRVMKICRCAAVSVSPPRPAEAKPTAIAALEQAFTK